MGGSLRMEHWCNCTLISFLSSQDLKEKILDQLDEACPTNIPAVLLAQDNLTGVSLASTILRDLLYHTALSSALGPNQRGT